MYFVGSYGDTGVLLGFSFSHDHPQEPPLIIKDRPTAVAMIKIKIQFKKIIACGGAALEECL